MAKAIAKWTGGIHSKIQAAARPDGVLFRRSQDKTRFGYQWGKWRRIGEVDPQNVPSSLTAGFAMLFHPNQYDDFNARLPND